MYVEQKNCQFNILIAACDTSWSTILHLGTWQMACFYGNVWTPEVSVQWIPCTVFRQQFGFITKFSNSWRKFLRSNWSFDESVLCDHPWWGLGLWQDLEVWHESFHFSMEHKPWTIFSNPTKFCGSQAHERTLSTDILFGLLKEADLRDNQWNCAWKNQSPPQKKNTVKWWKFGSTLQFASHHQDEN